jgi:hypothetical protein
MDEVMVEAVAMAIHDAYIRHEREAGQTPETGPSMVDWDELPEDLKESNRDQARHIDAKVEAIGCEVRPATDPAPAVREFSPQEVEHLARLEHHRWVGERRGAGWAAGLVKDADLKVTPHLVAWEDLSEEIKDYDRRTVENIPEVLATAGLQVVRKEV